MKPSNMFRRFCFTALFAVSTAAAFPQQTYRSESFSVPDMAISRSGQPTNEGLLFFAERPGPNTAPLIMTDANELIYSGQAGSNAQNVRLAKLNGQRVLSYWEGRLDNFAHGYGSVVLMDSTYQTLQTICLTDALNFVTPNPASFPGSLQSPCYVDRHESLITKKGTILVTAFNVTNYDLSRLGGPVNGWIFDSLFYEIDVASGEILFSWSALANVDPFTSNYVDSSGFSPLVFNGRNHGFTQDEPWDFFQIDSVQPYSKTGDYLVSSRTTWSIYRVDGRTGKITWTLEGSSGGDFTFADPSIFFSWQHTARMHSMNGNSIHIRLFADNNYPNLATQANVSYGYLLRLNERTKQVTLLQQFIDPSQPLYSLTEGSIQRLPGMGHALVSYGSEPVIKEYASDGSVIYTAQYAAITDPSGSEAGPHSYRAYRQFGWSATPYYAPKVVAFYPAGETGVTAQSMDVFMSWNGATDDVYDGWNVWAGTSDVFSEMTAVRYVPRKGFESSFNVPIGGKGYTHVVASATLFGNPVANSTVEAVQTTT